jgi:hypothetical protein
MVDSEPSSAVPHRNAATAFFEGVRDLLAQDPLLKDVPGTVTAEGVKEQLELEQGKSIRILLRRYGGDTVGKSISVYSGSENFWDFVWLFIRHY